MSSSSSSGDAKKASAKKRKASDGKDTSSATTELGDFYLGLTREQFEAVRADLCDDPNLLLPPSTPDGTHEPALFDHAMLVALDIDNIEFLDMLKNFRQEEDDEYEDDGEEALYEVPTAGKNGTDRKCNYFQLARADDGKAVFAIFQYLWFGNWFESASEPPMLDVNSHAWRVLEGIRSNIVRKYKTVQAYRHRVRVMLWLDVGQAGNPVSYFEDELRVVWKRIQDQISNEDKEAVDEATEAAAKPAKKKRKT